VAVLGWSAGAVHALAVAARHPALVTTVGIVAGLPPVGAYATADILRDASDDRRAVADLAGTMAPAEVGVLLGPLVARARATSTLPGSTCWREPTRSAGPRSTPCRGPSTPWAGGVVDAVAQGLGGLEHDIALQVTPPDIELGDVVCPVRLWYGTHDRAAPPAFGHWFAAHLPDARLDVLDGAATASCCPGGPRCSPR
jgi:pimeloyl-ACP methyl ester carboxylesterase